MCVMGLAVGEDTGHKSRFYCNRLAPGGHTAQWANFGGHMENFSEIYSNFYMLAHRVLA